jgi:hypothetical protein
MTCSCNSLLAVAAAFSSLTAVAALVTHIVSFGTVLGTLLSPFLNFVENIGHDIGLRFLCPDMILFYPSYEHCQSIDLS